MTPLVCALVPEVRVYPTECGEQLRRSLKSWELQIPCFAEFFWNHPCQSPSPFGMRLHFLRPHFPSPNIYLVCCGRFLLGNTKFLADNFKCCDGNRQQFAIAVHPQNILRGDSNGKVSIWARPSGFVLSCAFWDFRALSRIFRISCFFQNFPDG